MRNIELFVIPLCDLLAPKVLVTVLKNSWCVILTEGCALIESKTNGNI